MAFISWASELARAKEALAARKWSEYFTSSVENSEELRTTYTRLNDITRYIEWLETKASVESYGAEQGSLFFTIGGY